MGCLKFICWITCATNLQIYPVDIATCTQIMLFQILFRYYNI